MATIFRWASGPKARLPNGARWRVMLALAALLAALSVALISCGGDQESSPPAATPTMASTVVPASAGETPPPQPTEATASGETRQPQPTRAGATTSTAQESPTESPAQAEEPAEDRDRTLTVYSGRSQSLVHPLLEAFGDSTGIDIRVKYGGSASTAATLLEEGDNTPADVVFLQDPGSLGSLAASGMLADLPQATLDKVDSRLRDPNGRWVGTSGRARTIIYNTEAINPDTDLPDSVLDFTKEEWRGRVGWAPRNGSFQAFVTALRLQLGEDTARQWLEGMRENDAQEYPNNTSIVQAAANGEVDVGFVNHYYLERFLEEYGEEFEARNYYIGNGDPGALVLVAGAGILEASDNGDIALEFVDFLLSEPAQRYFTSDVKEYPVAAGVEPEGDLPPIESLDPPDVDLGSLSDLQGTIDLLREVGVIP